MTNQTLTPADLGILAAALDDARNDGLGDDTTCDTLAVAAVANRICAETEAWAVAYAFLRANR